MSEGRILISTHRLPLAGALRDRFERRGDPVELLTPDEAFPESGGRLLILTGGSEGTEARRWIDAARNEHEMPVLAVMERQGAGAVSEARARGIHEAFPPPGDPDEIALLARRLEERLHLQAEMGIVGETEGIREVLERVVQFAPVPSTVLITGESGTGKELVARGIHLLSPRRHRPFIAVNVAALPDTLLESELFGHEKGAFTGAVDARKGLFELAQHGTIFLDEIGEMPTATQTKLLRVLEQREFLRVGGERAISVDVRIIAATNQELRSMVQEDRFRRDLFYRLNVLSVHLPPLRERRADIPLLTRTFIREISSQMDRPFLGIAPEAMDILVRHYWPGNIRELRNLVESMVVLAPGQVIRPEDIPDEVRRPEVGRAPLPAPRRALALPTGSGEREPRPSVQPANDLSGPRDPRPELEFIFRTLVELRVDVDQLQEEFEDYRARVREGEIVEAEGLERIQEDRRREIQLEGGPPGERGSVHAPGESTTPEPAPSGRTDLEERVAFPPGMTMEELEREAIAAALRRLGGNRRKAAQELGIGERTLYRKIRKFGLDASGGSDEDSGPG